MDPVVNKTGPLQGRTVVLGITGGIAAYKTPELVRSLAAYGCRVPCILTESAAHFVSALVLQTLSGERVYTGMFEPAIPEIDHISLARRADAVVIAPATADTIARLAGGRADDLLGSVILATRAPVIICPGMNTAMWEHPATVANLERVRTFGYRIVGPSSGELACGEWGDGRLAPLDDIRAAVLQTITRPDA